MVDVDDVRVLEPCQASLNSSYGNKKINKVLPNLPHSNEAGAGRNRKFKASGVAVHDKAEELEMSSGGRVEFHSAGKPNGGNEDCVVMEMDVNQVMQSAPHSPPFCDTKGSDNDCSDVDSEHVRK